MLDDRSKLLLKALVERYTCRRAARRQSHAVQSLRAGAVACDDSQRHVRLGRLGPHVSPHTSAGRVSTARGYRLFVDTMLTVQPGGYSSHSLAADQPQKVIANAANLLSNLSQFVGVVMAPKRSSVFHHIEFLRLSERRLLVIIVSPEGDVQNRVIFTEADYTQAQLVEAANFLNSNYVGMDIDQVRERLLLEVESLRSEIATLMQAAVQVSTDTLHESRDEVVIAGERNLLSVSDFSSDMGNLRRAFDLFEQKAQLMRLLDVAGQAEGVRIFIGGESQVVPFEEPVNRQQPLRSGWKGCRHLGCHWSDTHAL